jgi:oryzin
MYTSTLVTQNNAPWGLGSISSRNPINSDGLTNNIYDSTAGAYTWSYIVGKSSIRIQASSEVPQANTPPDTGIRTTHVEFEGRATWGYNAVNSGNTDADFHGTFVAAVVGGKTYGVAKRTNLIAVKVFDIAGGYASQTLDGFQWAANDIVAKGRTGTAVINMSFGGGASAAMDRAVAAAYAKRVMSVSAAGNDNIDANDISPARAQEGICVGSISSNNARSSFSNWGSVVDIWAPGDTMESAWGSGDADRVNASGTSAASPFVAGLISYIRGLEGAMGPDDVRKKIVGYATAGKVVDAKGGANLIAYNNNGQR